MLPVSENQVAAKYRLLKRELTTKTHIVYGSEKFALKTHFFAGNSHDAPECRKIIKSLGFKVGRCFIIDCVY